MVTYTDADTSPVVDLTKDAETLKQGGEQWKSTSHEIRGALDKHGYLLVKYDAISNDEKQQLREAMHSFFDQLPLEAKNAVSNYKGTFTSYKGRRLRLPFYETLKFEHAERREISEDFTRLTWPQGNDDKLCNALPVMGSKFLDLNQMLVKMILDGYGLGQHEETLTGASRTPFVMIKYSTPEKESEQAIGLPEHVDPNYLSVLGPNEVAGLMIKNNLGEWVPIHPSKSHFVVFVGRALEVLTNGRLHATLHKVNIYGGKPRLSYGTFCAPKDEHIVGTLPEMVDDEHPLLFKPYKYLATK